MTGRTQVKPIVRFLEKFEVSDTGFISPCWLWTGSQMGSGSKEHKGYGSFHFEQHTVAAHQWAYEYWNGNIPAGKRPHDNCVCHSCDTRNCVNPDHLYIATQGKNMQDAVSRNRLWMNKVTHCPKGHPYDEENTYISPRGFRNCRTCHNDRRRKAA